MDRLHRPRRGRLAQRSAGKGASGLVARAISRRSRSLQPARRNGHRFATSRLRLRRGFDLHPRAVHRAGRAGAALHSRRRHLSGEPRATPQRADAVHRLGTLRAAAGCFARAVRGLLGLRRVSNRIVVTGTFPSPQRPSYHHAPHQGHPPALRRPDARCPAHLRTPDQREGNVRASNDHRPAPQRPRARLRIRLGASAGAGSVGTLLAGAALGQHGGGSAARGRDALRSVRVLLPRWQHHRRAEVPRDGNH